MTHEKAMKAATFACAGQVDCPDAWRSMIERGAMAYLDAFGVRDLGALVEAARRLVGDEMTDDRGICAALTPADETR